MLQRIAGPLKEFGVVVGILYVIDRILSGISPRLRLLVYELMAQPVPAESLRPERRRSSHAIREIRPGDPELASMPVRPEVMAARLANKATCLGAFNRSGEMIGYLWFVTAPYDEDEARCTYVPEPANESAFDFDFYLYPAHRMGMGFIILWNAAFEALARRGIRQTFSRMTRFNIASRRAHRRLGSVVVGRAIFLKAWSLEIMVSTVSPFVHVSTRPDDRVRLTLRAGVRAGV